MPGRRARSAPARGLCRPGRRRAHRRSRQERSHRAKPPRTGSRCRCGRSGSVRAWRSSPTLPPIKCSGLASKARSPACGAITPVMLEREPACRRGDRRCASPRMRLGGCARRRRLGDHQRPLQMCGGARWQAVRRLRHGAVDERLYVDERRDHGRRSQEIVAGRDADRRLHGPRGDGGGAAADDSGGARRLALPPDRPGRLASLAPSAWRRRTATPRSRCWRKTNRRSSMRPKRWSAAISTRCARSRARSCCPDWG